MPDRLNDASLIGATCVEERLYCRPATPHTANDFNEYVAVSPVKNVPIMLNMLITMTVFIL